MNWRFEGVHVPGGKELAEAANAAGVIEEGDEAGLDRGTLVLDIGADQGVGLPHLVGVGLGRTRIGVRL